MFGGYKSLRSVVVFLTFGGYKSLRSGVVSPFTFGGIISYVRGL